MTLREIDSPGLKQILWHTMRGDLQKYIPDAAETELLMCPTCCRFLPYDDFCIEHIIPQQALDDDPVAAKAALSRNERSVTILLCSKHLVLKGKFAYNNGCNSWKGRYFDKSLREIFNGRVSRGDGFNSRHQVALFSACFLGLFSRLGYQIPLTPSGVLMRKQFFSPNRFIQGIPAQCQMAMMGEPLAVFDRKDTRYWIPPFKFAFDADCGTVVVRNVSTRLPLSRNPESPIVRYLAFAPPKFKLRPDFITVFE